MDHLGHLVVGQSLPAVVAQCLGIGSGFGNHESMAHFVEDRVSDPDHRCDAHRRMILQTDLDLPGVGVVAAGLEHFGHPADDSEAAVRAHDHQVAGVEPALGVDGLGGRLGTVPVAGHNPVAPHLDLARFARLSHAVVGGHYPELVAGDGYAHRVEDHVHIGAGRSAEDAARRLAHSVAGGAALDVGGGQQTLQYGCRHGGATPRQLSDTGEIGFCEVRVGGAELEHRGHAAPDPDPLLGNGGQDQRRVEPLLEDNGTTGHHLATADVADGPHMVDGQVAEDLLVPGAAGRRPGHPAPADSAVGEQCALGPARAPRGVDDEPGVHGLDLGPPFGQGIGVDHRAGPLEVDPFGCIDSYAALDPVDLGHQAVGQTIGSRGHPVKDDARSGVCDDV